MSATKPNIVSCDLFSVSVTMVTSVSVSVSVSVSSIKLLSSIEYCNRIYTLKMYNW